MPDTAHPPEDGPCCGQHQEKLVFALGAAGLVLTVLAGELVAGLVGALLLLWVARLWRQKAWCALFDALGRLPNPRFGPERLIAAALVRLREFHGAEACLAVLAHESGVRVHCVSGHAPGARMRVCPRLGVTLLALPERACVRAGFGGWARGRLGALAGQGPEGELWLPDAARAQPWPAAPRLQRCLGRRAWVSVPLIAGGLVQGRLYILGGRRSFSRAWLRHLEAAAGRLMPLVDALTLLDTLASAAGERARRKISLDLHDSAIQPYLGLRLGLEALRRKVDPGSPLAGEVDELQRVTEDCINELRGYVRGLRGQPERRSTALRDGLERQAARFGLLYGLQVSIDLPPSLRIPDRLAAEVVRMVGEGLSNIGRHTASRRVSVRLSSSGGLLLARIINDGESGVVWRDFTPRSLTHRAEHLGGTVHVDPHGAGGSCVLVSIPM